MALKPGEKLAPWLLGEELGRGGNAIVFSATSEEFPAPVAVKGLKVTNRRSEPYRRFVREVTFLERLGEFPGVLPVLRTHLPEQGRERPWLAMPIARRLDEALADASLEAVVEAVHTIAATLAHLAAEHRLGHRDVLSRVCPGLDLPSIVDVGARFVSDRSGGLDASALLDGFAAWLAERGRGSYTQRSYGQGAAYFARWLEEHGVELAEVGRATVIEYVAGFRQGRDGVGRAPRTVNHRVSVLAALFECWEQIDPEWWSGREPPVPAVRPVMDGSHGMPGRDPVRRGRRAELRVRVPRTVPRRVEPEVAVALIEAARSWRDKALLMLLISIASRSPMTSGRCSRAMSARSAAWASPPMRRGWRCAKAADGRCLTRRSSRGCARSRGGSGCR